MSKATDVLKLIKKVHITPADAIKETKKILKNNKRLMDRLRDA